MPDLAQYRDRTAAELALAGSHPDAVEAHLDTYEALVIAAALRATADAYDGHHCDASGAPGLRLPCEHTLKASDWLRARANEIHPPDTPKDHDMTQQTAARPTDGPIHTWFGLSYCNYQVLHRTLMQSMPIGWQERMVACLEELADAYRHIEKPEAFAVEAGEQHLVDELTEQQMRQLGITCDEYDDDPPDGLADEDRDEWEEQHRLAGPVFRDANLDEIDGQSYVVVPTFDPVPHYNRGRTYIEPQATDGSVPR